MAEKKKRISEDYYCRGEPPTLRARIDETQSDGRTDLDGDLELGDIGVTRRGICDILVGAIGLTLSTVSRST